MDHSGWSNRAAGSGQNPTDFEKGFIRAQTISFEDFIITKVNKARKKQAKCVQKVKIHRERWRCDELPFQRLINLLSMRFR